MERWRLAVSDAATRSLPLAAECAWCTTVLTSLPGAMRGTLSCDRRSSCSAASWVMPLCWTMASIWANRSAFTIWAPESRRPRSARILHTLERLAEAPGPAAQLERGLDHVHRSLGRRARRAWRQRSLHSRPGQTWEGCYRRRLLPGQGRLPSSSGRSRSSSSTSRPLFCRGGTSSFSNQSSVSV